MKSIRTVDKQPVITAGIYAANDVVGGLITLPIGKNDSGKLVGIAIADDGDVKAEFNIHFFDAAPTSIVDNAAYAPTIADLQKRVTTVNVPTANYTTVNGNAYADVAPTAYYDADRLYAYIVAVGTPTFTAIDDLFIRFFFQLD